MGKSCLLVIYHYSDGTLILDLLGDGQVGEFRSDVALGKLVNDLFLFGFFLYYLFGLRFFGNSLIAFPKDLSPSVSIFLVNC